MKAVSPYLNFASNTEEAFRFYRSVFGGELQIERGGRVERRRQAQFRPCRLQAEPLKDVAEWLEQYRRFWEESFDRLDDYLQRLQSEEKDEP